jgi:hypothetical protein
MPMSLALNVWWSLSLSDVNCNTSHTKADAAILHLAWTREGSWAQATCLKATFSFNDLLCIPFIGHGRDLW